MKSYIIFNKTVIYFSEGIIQFILNINVEVYKIYNKKIIIISNYYRASKFLNKFYSFLIFFINLFKAEIK